MVDTLAAPNSTASPTPPLCPGWFAVCTRKPSPTARPAPRSTGLVYVEGPDLTEDVHPADMGDNFAQHLTAHQIYIVICGAAIGAPDEPQGR
ncbi:MAG: hypothetical protein R2709_00085 [Marmoricola sp.]